MALDFATGCLGGCAGVLAGQPFDVIKVRLVSQSGAAKQLYNHGRGAFFKILKIEGMRGLYKGLTAPIYGQGFINAIIFGTQHGVMRLMPDNSLASQTMAGATAGLTQSFVASPVELARIRMSNAGINVPHAQHQYKSAFRVLFNIYKEEGLFRGVYRGIVPTIIRDFPAFGVYFGSYEYICRWLSGSDTDRSATVIFFAGGMAGALSWLLVYPPDLIKTRMQDKNTYHLYRGTWDCIKQVWRSAGIRGMFVGITVAVFRAFPVNAATFFVEEHSRQMINSCKAV